MLPRRSLGESPSVPAEAANHRVAALDGIRGLAIILVLLNHFAAGVDPHFRPFFPFGGWKGHGGGLLGVQLFFVLSGYLISLLLLKEWQKTGTISFRAFYLRRLRRLVPALLVLCILYGLYVLAVDPKALTLALGAIVRALTFTGNLPSPIAHDYALTHTWSLAVEEQFYLVWPVTLAWCLRHRPPLALWVALGVGLTTIALREAIPHVMPGTPGTTVQYNLLRWDAMMAGAGLALRPLRPPKWVGGVGLAAFALMLVWTPAVIPGWEYTLATLASAALVACAGHLGFLKNAALVHLGLISYSLYLWHAVLLRWVLPGPIALLLCLTVAEASFRIVERPSMRYLFRKANRSAVMGRSTALTSSTTERRPDPS